MKLSEQHSAAAEAWAKDNQDLFAFMRGITVQFYGKAAGKTGMFTATGVAVRVTARGADIVTAKHNLTIAGGTAGSGQVAHFRENIKAQIYDVGGRQVAQAPIAAVHLPVAGALNAGYDVAVMRVTDAKFCQYLRTLAGDGGLGETFRPESYADSGWIVELPAAADALSVLTNGRPFPYTELEEDQNFELVQLGYGIYQAALYGFTHRALPIAGLVNAQFIETHDGWTDVFIFDADDTFTGAPGDSGGPLFAVSPVREGVDTRSVRLFAVHSGANYFADQANDHGDDAPTTNNAITLVNSSLAMPQ